MYSYKYPHPSVTTDCVVFGFDGIQLKILLIERGFDPYKGHWAFPGGFVEIDESCEEGVLRELKEETGLLISGVEQFHTFSAPNRDPRERVITVAYYTLMNIQEVQGGDDAAQAAWFTLDHLPPLAFDHDQMLQLAIQRLRERIHFEPIGLGVLPEKFTIAQLQHLYEAILGMRLDQSHFMQKLSELNILTPLSETVTPSSGQAALYCFQNDRYNELKQHRVYPPISFT
jgi:8-oxo-dGTP diphosphatase